MPACLREVTWQFSVGGVWQKSTAEHTVDRSGNGCGSGRGGGGDGMGGMGGMGDGGMGVGGGRLGYVPFLLWGVR